MKLIDHFIPLMAFVRSLKSNQNRTLETLSQDIDSLIHQAQSQALKQGVDLSEFQEALFPVLAWSDERISQVTQATHEHGWQRFLLQHRYFKTRMAGREFFDRLSQLAPDSVTVREVYLYCLCLGFLGRYSLSPNDTDLTRLRMEQYQLLRHADQGISKVDGSILFPHAYAAVAAGPSSVRRHKRRYLGGRVLLFVLPVLILLLTIVVLHAELTLSVQHFREAFNL